MAKEKNIKSEKKYFMKDFKAELKKVVWPTSKQMVSNVTAVISIVLITAAIVFVLDFIFMGINEYGINKLKNHVQSKQQSQTQLVEDTTTNEQNNNEQTDNQQNSDNTENKEQANNENNENNNSDETTAE